MEPARQKRPTSTELEALGQTELDFYLGADDYAGWQKLKGDRAIRHCLSQLLIAHWKRVKGTKPDVECFRETKGRDRSKPWVPVTHADRRARGETRINVWITPEGAKAMDALFEVYNHDASVRVSDRKIVIHVIREALASAVPTTATA